MLSPQQQQHRQRQQQPGRRRRVARSWWRGCLLSVVFMYHIIYDQMDIIGRLSRGMVDHFEDYDHDVSSLLLSQGNSSTIMMGSDTYVQSTRPDETALRPRPPSSLSFWTKERLRSSAWLWGDVPPASSSNRSSRCQNINCTDATSVPILPPPTTTIIRLHENETFMWLGRQQRLCRRLKREERERRKTLKLHQHKNHHYSKDSSPPLAAPRTTQMLLRTNCTSLHSQHRHGNLLYGFYAMHLAAMAFDVDFVFVCLDQHGPSGHNHHGGDESDTEGWKQQQPQHQTSFGNLFWWLQSEPESIEWKRSLLLSPLSSTAGTQQGDDDADRATSVKLSRQSACHGMGKIPLQHATELVRYQLRHMALAIFGSRPSSTNERIIELPHRKYSDVAAAARTNPTSSLPLPLYPAEELDTVVIHFRCGDVLSNLNQRNDTGNYGLLPFFVYREMIETVLKDANDTDTIDSIGIVTAPFVEPHSLRNEDVRHASQCQDLVESLQEYLQSSFSVNATRVTIRNNPNDTIPMVYSRLVLATKACICIRSTFCVFPTLSSFAKKRIFLKGGVNYFLTGTHDDDGLIVWKSKGTPYLLSHEAHILGWNRTKAWLLQKTTITKDTSTR